MHYFPRLQGLETTPERGANIAIIVAIPRKGVQI